MSEEKEKEKIPVDDKKIKFEKVENVEKFEKIEKIEKENECLKSFNKEIEEKAKIIEEFLNIDSFMALDYAKNMQNLSTQEIIQSLLEKNLPKKN